ncbi:MAG: aldo/keto reductase [Trueperaceae bacterium]|nr:aldo/keto reductase [Trueperaceae bacterium]
MPPRPPPPHPHELRATGLAVSRIGLGLAALGRPGYLNVGHGEDLAGDRSVAAMEARAHAVLDAAWAGGVRAFDAGRSYGRAEAFLASWLARRDVAPGEALVSSKWGYTYTAEWRVDAQTHEVKEHSLAALRRQWPESRALLGDHLGLYQVHSVTPDSPALDDAALLAELAALRRQGLRIGLTTSGPRQAAVIERAIELRIDGERLFDAVQATWNLLEPSAGVALAAARAAGMGVIVKEALANGRLTDRQRDEEAAAGHERLAHGAARLSATVDALALAAVLAQPWADVVLSGATTVPQLQANLRALEVVWDAEAAEALAPLAEPSEAYWRRRAAMPWT